MARDDKGKDRLRDALKAFSRGFSDLTADNLGAPSFDSADFSVKEVTRDVTVSVPPGPRTHNVTCMVWHGSGRILGNWGHVALDSGSSYLSVWPGIPVQPQSPVGKVVPAPAETSTYEQDMLSEAEEFEPLPEAVRRPRLPIMNSDGDPDPLAEAALDAAFPLSRPVPKPPDSRIELALTKEEFERVAEEMARLNKGVAEASVYYSAVRIGVFGESVNCLTSVAAALRSTPYYTSEFDKAGMLPAQFADVMKARREMVAAALAKAGSEAPPSPGTELK